MSRCLWPLPKKEAEVGAESVGAETARSLGIGVGTVNRYLYRAQAAKLTSWPLPPELDDDAALTALLFADEGKVRTRPEFDVVVAA